MRESGTPLSICEVERVRRVEAMDELKRVIGRRRRLALRAPHPAHGGPRETPTAAKRDAPSARSSTLILHAHHAGVAICIENSNSEWAILVISALSLMKTRLSGLRSISIFGHAHLSDFPEDNERIEKVFRR